MMKIPRRWPVTEAEVDALGPYKGRAPDRTLTADQLRDRRRHALHVTLCETFDLSAEVDAILTPIAEQMTAELRYPERVRRLVDDVAMSTEDVVSLVVSLLADRNAARDGLRSPRLTRDLARRPKAPEITTDALVSGQWAQLLAAYAGAVAPALADLLGRAMWPENDRLRGQLSASERVVAALRGLDGAAQALSRQIPRNATYEAAERRRDERQAEREAAEAAAQREALEVLGVAW